VLQGRSSSSKESRWLGSFPRHPPMPINGDNIVMQPYLRVKLAGGRRGHQ
jgi:hypothetical protein